ncbi:hypothetical protein DFH28DRAFT_903769 [Melampsora americana]|nr:hypothetical protein DFH28DRAFT_903769 [Melampsora americana]
MSNSMQTHVFLPSYILNFATDEAEPKIDVNLFLSQASNPQILEVILAFYPHFTITEAANNDRAVLHKTFLEMVARHLSNVPVPSNREPPAYFHAKLGFPMFGPLDSHTTVAPGSEIDGHRIEDFNNLVFVYLRNGQYRQAGENLVAFIKTHKHLNEDEIYEIGSAEEQALEGLDECLRSLRRAHEDVEAKLLLLSEPDISPTDRQHVHSRLESANIILQSCEKTFQGALRDVGYLSALVPYYQ